MKDTTSGKRHPSIVAKWFGRCALVFLVVILVAEVGAYLPKLPYMGAVGAIIVAAYASWIILGGLLSTIVLVFVWRHWRTASLTTGVIVSSVVTLLAVVVIIRIVLAVYPFGIWINPFGGLGNTSVSGSPSDAEAAYGTFLGKPLPVLIYRPHQPQRHRMPVMVYVHGGGWIMNTADLRSKDMRWFADHGWLVFSVEYALSSDLEHLWNVTPDQISCALAWIKDHAIESGGDSSNLFMVGESAGGISSSMHRMHQTEISSIAVAGETSLM
jgi:hypothetical protein